MKTKVGLWIDHRKAVIVHMDNEKEENITVMSEVDKQLGRIDGIRSVTPFESQKVIADDTQEQKYMASLNEYYGRVYSTVSEADSFLIFGPGEAKTELQKFIENNHLGIVQIEIETVDKMTDAQITAKVKQYFQ